MAGVLGQPDEPAALARLLSQLSQRVARLETQNRLKDATLDAPGVLQFKDLDGKVRFRIGLDDMGGVGYSGFDTNGTLRLRLGQNMSGQVVYEGFEPDGTVRFRLGEDPNGGVGYRAFDGNGQPLLAAEQAQGNDPQTVRSTTYTDAGPALTVSATAGPSGQMLIVMSAVVHAVERTVTSTGFMTFASTGGRTTAALDVNSLQVSEPLVDVQTETAIGAEADHTHGQAGEAAEGADHYHLMYPAMGPPAARPFRGSRTVLLPGCSTTGPTVVTAKYRVSNAGGPYLFDDRSLVVVPL